MIGLDTNVLVRYITQDDPKQSPIANRLMEALTPQAPGYVPLVVVVELGWVLCGAYGLDRGQWARALEGLLRTQELRLEQAELVWQALRSFQSAAAADFADCLIERSAAAAGCEYTLSFDRGAVKGCGMVLAA